MNQSFTESISPKDLADIIWEGIAKWSIKHGDSFRKSFGDYFDKDLEVIFDEMVYFKAFSTDYAFNTFFNNDSYICDRLSVEFIKNLHEYALSHKCKPLPPGKWVSDGLIWIPTGAEPKEIGDPLQNLNNRFILYTQAINRKHPSRHVQEALSYLFAAWCGTTDISFILFANEISMGDFIFVKNISQGINIRD